MTKFMTKSLIHFFSLLWNSSEIPIPCLVGIPQNLRMHLLLISCDFFGTPIICLVGTTTRNLCKYSASAWNRTPWWGKAQLLKSWSQVLPPWSQNLCIGLSGLNIVSSSCTLNRLTGQSKGRNFLQVEAKSHLSFQKPACSDSSPQPLFAWL